MWMIVYVMIFSYLSLGRLELRFAFQTSIPTYQLVGTR
jgi:hypothetical protein